MNRSTQRKAAGISWARANILSAAADIPAPKARNFISTYKNTPDAQQLYDYLDNEPSFRDKYGKDLINHAQTHASAKGTKIPRHSLSPELQRRIGEIHDQARQARHRGGRRTKRRRASKGDPTRTPRAGAPNPFEEVTPEVFSRIAERDTSSEYHLPSIPIELLASLRELQRTYGEYEVRTALNNLETLLA